MKIAVIGLNPRTASVELRERMSFSKEQAGKLSTQILAHGLMHEVLVLSTCNRTELYGVPDRWTGNRTDMLENFLMSYRNLQPEKVNGSLYRHIDRDAVRHTYRVASGLDSMMLGEADILGQVRAAYSDAYKLGVTGRVLNRLFQSAIEVGKRVRTDTGIGMRPMSVAFAGVKLAEKILTSFKERRGLILGAGVTSERVLRHLCDRGMQKIRILHRSDERSQTLATRYGGEALPWEDLGKSLEWPDLVVTSVASSEPVLTPAMLQKSMAKRKNRTLVLMDLGVPRNIAPSVGDLKNVCLYDIDSLKKIVLQNLKACEQEIPRAEAIVEEHIQNFTRWQAGVSACSILRDLRGGYQLDRNTFLLKHLDAMSHYSDEERAYVMELLKKFLNGSTPEDGRDSQEELDMQNKVRALSAFCTHFGDNLGRN